MHSKSILCIDDDHDTCELLTFVLGQENYHVVTSSSATEAQEKVEREHFDLYLFDLYLPDKSGLELCSQVRKLDPNVPVFFCSADARKSTQQQALEAGATHFLPKPVDPQNLIHLIKTCLKSVDAQSLEAKVAELMAISDEIAERQKRIGKTLSEAKEMASQVQEYLLKMKAHQAFLSAGGTLAAFEQLWPDVWQHEILSQIPTT